MRERVIDLHTHVLPGLDDGAATLDDSVAMARAMVEDGVRTVVATPHVREDYPTTADEMEAALATLRRALSDRGVAIEVLPGAEIALDVLPRLDEPTRRRLGLGGNPQALLLEFPYSGWPLALVSTVEELVRTGVVPVIAHPERSLEVAERPERLLEIVQAGARIQVTAASLDGRLGRRVEACTRTLLGLGLVHAIASDAHGPDVRAAGLSRAVAAVGDAGLARWLVEDAPHAMISGDPLPSHPVPSRRRSLFGRR